MRAFYAALGWVERPGSDDELSPSMPTVCCSPFYPLGRLRDEAAPGAPLPESDWNGVTIGMNVGTVQEVDEVLNQAMAVGARSVADPVKGNHLVALLVVTVVVYLILRTEPVFWDAFDRCWPAHSETVRASGDFCRGSNKIGHGRMNGDHDAHS